MCLVIFDLGQNRFTKARHYHWGTVLKLDPEIQSLHEVLERFRNGRS